MTLTLFNRLVQDALTEMISTYTPNRPLETGVPTERLINLYQKFGNGGYGVLLTGNVMIHPVSSCPLRSLGLTSFFFPCINIEGKSLDINNRHSAPYLKRCISRPY